MDLVREVGKEKRLAILQNGRVGLHEDDRFLVFLPMPQLLVVQGIVHSYSYNLHYLISLKFRRLNITARWAYSDVFCTTMFSGTRMRKGVKFHTALMPPSTM